MLRDRLPLAALALPLLVLGPAPLHASAPEPLVRVLLQEAPTVRLAAVTVPVQLRDDSGRALLTLRPGEGLTARLGDGQLLLQRLPLGAAEPNLEGGALRLELRALWLDPQTEAPGTAAVALGERSYRGRLQLRPGAGALQVINHVGVENYLPGVVASEMPPSWPQAALRAQAIAARTYALRQRRPDAAYDLRATTASQVYGGLQAETESTRQAVAATRSLVLLHGGQLINAVFHSSSGGRTENSGELWTSQLPYLVSVDDGDSQSPVHRWRERFGPQQLQQAFPEIGGLIDLQVLSTSSTGRLRQLKLQGPAGSLVLTGAELRQRLKLRSTQLTLTLERPLAAQLPESLQVVPVEPPPVDSASGAGADPVLAATTAPRPFPVRSPAPRPSLVVEGRGFGHGVGLSQWGAYAMALKGASDDRILRHFYRGVEIQPLQRP
ncbi:MAG: SpoIID/LytB domain-containing protein [Prochlorococcaceae cyanobacterium]